LLDVHVRATTFFEDCLRRPEGANAREYLKGRGLDAETIARFRIGYAPDSGFLLRDALRREFNDALLRESGLFSWKESSEDRAQGAGPGFQEKRALRPSTPKRASDARSGDRDSPQDDNQGEDGSE